MQLIGYFRSSAAFRVRIALNLKGIKVDHSFRHLRKGEHRAPDYVAINPQKLVPALVLDSGEVLTQSMAILEYLEETHPNPPLLPKDPVGRARVRSLALIPTADVHPIQNLRVMNYLREHATGRVYQIALIEATYYGPVPVWGDAIGPWRYSDFIVLPPAEFARKLSGLGFEAIAVSGATAPRLEAQPGFHDHFTLMYEMDNARAYRIVP